jgi:hypothetical protein
MNAESALGKGKGKELISAQAISKQILEQQEGREWAGDKSLSEARQLADHRANLLRQ